MYIAMEQVKNCNFLGKIPQDHLGFTSTTILIIVSCIFTVRRITDQKLFHTLLQSKNRGRKLISDY
jgi:hypothetical protein